VQPYLQWNSDEEVYLGAGVYKGRKVLGQVVVQVPTPAYVADNIGEGMQPGTSDENAEWVWKWLWSNGDMGHDPYEMLTDDARYGNEFPKEALKVRD
jgi:hypothetical protein